MKQHIFTIVFFVISFFAGYWHGADREYRLRKRKLKDRMPAHPRPTATKQ